MTTVDHGMTTVDQGMTTVDHGMTMCRNIRRLSDTITAALEVLRAVWSINSTSLTLVMHAFKRLIV